jgi:tetratricopeptide (TPR) repeat protein
VKHAWWLLLLCVPGAHAQQVCAGCHPKVFQTYSKSAMGRSFQRVQPGIPAGDYFHQASNTHFAMIERNGKLFQRRWQTGFQGREENVDEKSVDYVMGSGNHTRTYLHRAPSGALQQLPLAWYAENGGYWAMNPGYDKPDQPNSRRKISYECMSCHNATPSIPAGQDQPRAEPVYIGALPEGIDCQRCHGSGANHVRVAQTSGASPDAIRAAIVNPARLPADRQTEVCMQCHLETDSFPFPHSIAKYDRGTFGFKPGEALGDAMLFFDHAQREDSFQIVNSAYRLRMSQCFLKSAGTLQCTTCHNPHDDSPRDYNAVCETCHKTPASSHTSSRACVDCHMPKRRTDDVVHVTMTDHFIQRRKPTGDLLAAKRELNGPETVYRGEVLPYYPQPFPRGPEAELYLASAQVLVNNNADAGIARLTDAITKYRPAEANFYINLGEALLNKTKPIEAVPLFEEAMRREPKSLAALQGLGQALDALNQPAKAADVFRQATQVLPSDAFSWQQMGQELLKLGRTQPALEALRKSIELDPEVPEAHYALGTFLPAAGAEASLREAIRLQPDYAAAHLNLAIVLSRRNALAEAEYQYKTALQLRPDYPLAHRNYGLMLRSVGRTAEAEEQLRQSN